MTHSNAAATNNARASFDDVNAYCWDNGLHEWVDPQEFVTHYNATGWMCGKTPVADWRAMVDKWAARARKEKYGY